MEDRNRQLMLAYTVHELSLCPKCGYPRSVCESESGFTAQKRVCHASAVVERAEKDARDNKVESYGVMWIPTTTDLGSGGTAAQAPEGMFD